MVKFVDRKRQSQKTQRLIQLLKFNIHYISLEIRKDLNKTKIQKGCVFKIILNRKHLESCFFLAQENKNYER